MYIKTDVEGLVKDSETGAILNVDTSKLEAYRKQKRFIEERKIESYRIQKVEKDLSEIKSLLQDLLRDRNS